MRDYKTGRLVTLDPGLRGCGVATFFNGELVRGCYVKNPEKKLRGPVAHSKMALAAAPSVWPVDFVIVEFPQVYPGAPSVDLNDLLDVAGVASALISRFEGYPCPVDCRYVLPREWKGNIQKDIMTQRIKNSLGVGELNCIEWVGAKDHNTLDAAGIGLWALGRLNRKVYG